MNILLIGNRFDLAHDLPTGYKELLKFVEVIKQIIDLKNHSSSSRPDWKNIHSEISKRMLDNANKLFGEVNKWGDIL